MLCSKFFGFGAWPSGYARRDLGRRRGVKVGLHCHKQPGIAMVSAPVASMIMAFSSAASSAIIGGALINCTWSIFPTAGLIVGLVALATVVAVEGFVWSIARLGAGKASIVSTVEPVVAVFLGWVLFGQHTTFWQLMWGHGREHNHLALGSQVLGCPNGYRHDFLKRYCVVVASAPSRH